jgi:beta-mannosidase
LLFNGLDTFTNISLCGQRVASTNNQFRQWYFDTTSVLASCNGTATLTIDFDSAVNVTQKFADTPGQEVWPYGVEQVYEWENRQFMRKEQSDFGWDWGPGFAPAGIWQPAYVVQLLDDEIYIRNTLLDIHREGQMNNMPPDQTATWVVTVSFDILGNVPVGAVIMVDVIDKANKTVSSSNLENITISDSSITGNTVLLKNDFALWWPTGLGAQNLYNFRFTVMQDDRTIATVTKRSGFRTIVLNMEPVSQIQLSHGVAPGNNFHFEVNGHEFYAKGSNFIPPDAFWPRVTQQKMERLFQSVIDGNQNMLRVWASGVYAPDFIYDLADEMGILLWSEFQFGCALYPVEPGFLENVRQEAEYNVRRVNHHPSLALWAGGNELENLELPMAGGYGPDGVRWVKEYEQLFLGILLTSVFSNTKSISYIPSSTTNGYISLNFSNPNPYVPRYDNTTQGSIYGDTDHYNYDYSVAFDTSSYPIGRFANEFGFHSMPSLSSWRQAIPDSELDFNSTMVILRTHHYVPGSPTTTNFAAPMQGISEMIGAAEMFYPKPKNISSNEGFSAWCLATQLFQAEFYKSQIAFYRRGSGMPERHLGSLYWQLNDIWQAPTWAGLEYDGRWKILHYLAKNIYEPVIIAPYWDEGTGNLTAYVTSDLWTEVNGTATLQWYGYNGSRLGNSSDIIFSVGGLNTTMVLQTNTNNLIWSLSDAFLKLNITAVGTLPNTNVPQIFKHEAYFHQPKLGQVHLADPGLTLSYNEETMKLLVEAKNATAVFVWLEMPENVVGNFEENAFWLLPSDGPKTIGINLKDITSSPNGVQSNNSWVSKITVRSLWDNTLL